MIDYQKKAWGQPILIGLGGINAYFIVAFFIGVTPISRPPVFAAYFAEATKAKKASSFAKATADKTTGRGSDPMALSGASRRT